MVLILADDEESFKSAQHVFYRTHNILFTDITAFSWLNLI